jgi:hypothetical protein
MKRSVGASAGLLVSLVVGWGVNHLAGTTPGVPPVSYANDSNGSGKTRASSPVTKPTSSRTAIPLPGCTAFEQPNLAVVDDENRGEAAKIIDRFTRGHVDGIRTDQSNNSLEYMVALVPDPRHTHLSILFDRSIDAIEDAAQDEQFTYDSSWIPWRTEKVTYSSRDDEIAARTSLEAREECPGILLFRKSVGSNTPNDAYSNGLVVFVVGEQPTGGLNSAQWDYAIHWLSQPGRLNGSRALRVLGPTFSGTLPSLYRKLEQLSTSVLTPSKNFYRSAYVFSGTVGSCPSVEWFQQRLTELSTIGVRFGVFQENDELQLYRFLEYLKEQHEELNDVAILSEDETAYGGSLEYSSNQDKCNFLYLYDKKDQPVDLFYPRDISALRTAYQAQSIFSQGHSGAENKEGAHSVLSDDFGSESTEEGDTPATYSNQRIALTEEAQLYGLVSFLRSHHTRYIALRGSNPLDYLFLTRFLHHAFPEGRVVTVGSEMLFTRERDTTEFRGTMALTNFPLMPRGPHWSRLFTDSAVAIHGHRVFSSNTSEGLYLGARFLMNTGESPEPKGQTVFQPIAQGEHFKELPFKETIPDFADPYWLQSGKSSPLVMHRNTWLTVLGRDGYWPIAVLNDDQTEKHQPPPPPNTEAEMSLDKGHYDPTFSMGMQPPMPWLFATCTSLLLIIWHALVCSRGKGTSWVYVFSAFRSREGITYRFLITASTAFAFTIPVLLFTPLIRLWFSPYWSTPLLGTSYRVLILIMIFGICVVCRKLTGETRPAVLIGGLCSLLAMIVLVNINNSNEVAYYYRAVHLTNAVTPLLPLLILFGGLYICAWQNLAGDALLSKGRPELPRCCRGSKASAHNIEYLSWLYCRASARMALRIEKFARPCSLSWNVIVAPGAVLLISLFCFLKSLPVLSLEGSLYRKIVNFILLAILLIIASGSGRLFCTWRELKRLLLQLGRMPLCRTFSALRDISGRSLWAMSGHVPRSQFKFFSQQMDAVKRLLHEFAKPLDEKPDQHVRKAMLKQLDEFMETGEQFSKRYLANLDYTTQWDQAVSKGGNSEVEMRPLIAKSAAAIFNGLLEPEWEKEVQTTDCLLDQSRVGIRSEGVSNEGEKRGANLPLSKDTKVQAGEEFVCLLYISYIQNILARMRTIIISISALYVSMMLALAFYPFAPRPSIALWMLLALIALGLVVAVVYVGLERDPILSYITNTSTDLGWEFWIKYAAFLVPPVLALLTAQFPEIADSVMQWIQPGLDAVK